MILYIHGFNSSSQSGKALAMGQWMAGRGLGESFAAPDLPHRPAEAIGMLEALIDAAHGKTKLVGSSLGGFYATWLAEKHDLKAVLVNPCVHCDEKLSGQIDQLQTNWHDGGNYLFTERHHAELTGLHLAALRRPQNFLLLVETGDAVLDHCEAVAYYTGARQVVLPGGDHGFSRFLDYLPDIVAF